MADEPATSPQKDSASSLLREWRQLLTQAADESERFAKERPIVALVVAFIAGVVFNALVSALFRRGRR